MNAAHPLVSVVIPTRDRLPALARCLESLATQDYPSSSVEIVVVNDGGTPIPPEMQSGLKGTSRLTMLDVAHGGPAAARNAGVAAARGAILAFIDDDCVAERGWVAALVAGLQQHPKAAVGGQVRNALTDNPYARASHHLIAFLYRYYHEENRGALPFFTTNNLGVTSEQFAAVGGFDASFPFASEDRDWSDRLLHRGGRLVHVPQAIVYHAHDLTLGSFLRQHFRYGQGAHLFHQRRASRRGTPVRLEQGAFYSGMLRQPFTAGDQQAARVTALIVASQVVGAVGWAVAASRGALMRLKGSGPR
jgi:GT2 family glycosyltransferase